VEINSRKKKPHPRLLKEKNRCTKSNTIVVCFVFHKKRATMRRTAHLPKNGREKKQVTRVKANTKRTGKKTGGTGKEDIGDQRKNYGSIKKMAGNATEKKGGQITAEATEEGGKRTGKKKKMGKKNCEAPKRGMQKKNCR